MIASSRGPAPLIALAVLLSVGGAVLVGVGISGNGADAARTATSSAAGSSPPSPPRTTAPARPSPPTSAAPSPTGRPERAAGSQNLPPTLSGPGADATVQRALDQAIPPELPADVAQEIADLGRRVWLAEVTGTGRSQWPGYFPARARVTLYTRVRVQAVIGRRDREGPGAVAHLVWAGAGPTGTYMDSRSATVRFIRKGESGTWTPQR